MISKKNIFNNSYWLYIGAIIFGLLCLITKLDGFDFYYGKYLWAEDGKLFLNQAQEFGYKSLFKPYEGYLHIYPRLVAILAISFDLLYRPIVLLIGGLLAYSAMVFSIARAAKIFELGFAFSFLLIALVASQPNNGENFFNLANSQWMLGAALFLCLLIDDDKKDEISFFQMLLLIIGLLTGPFSVILVGMLIIKLILLNDWRERRHVYVVVGITGMIQSIILLSSDRVTNGQISHDIFEWISAFSHIFFLNTNKISTVFTVVFFWVLFICLFVKEKNHKLSKIVFLMIVAVVLLIVASLYSHKDHPLSIVALGGGNRYSLIPCILIFTASILLAHKNIYSIIIVASLISFLNFSSFTVVHSSNLQFKSFANFSQYKDVSIPIYPLWEQYPGWHIKAGPKDFKKIPSIQYVDLKFSNIKYESIELIQFSPTLSFNSKGNDPSFLFNSPIQCKNSTDVGVEIEMDRNIDGWLQLFWSDSFSFSEQKSLRLWYHKDKIKAQFAFENIKQDIFLRFDPMEAIGHGEISSVRVFCLNKLE